VFDVAKKFKVDLGKKEDLFFVNSAIAEIHHRMVN